MILTAHRDTMPSSTVSFPGHNGREQYSGTCPFLQFPDKRFRAFIMGDNLQQIYNIQNTILYTGTPNANYHNTGITSVPVYTAPNVSLRFGSHGRWWISGKSWAISCNSSVKIAEYKLQRWGLALPTNYSITVLITLYLFPGRYFSKINTFGQSRNVELSAVVPVVDKPVLCTDCSSCDISDDIVNCSEFLLK